MFICKVCTGIHIHFNQCQTFKLNSILSYSIHSVHYEFTFKLPISHFK